MLAAKVFMLANIRRLLVYTWPGHVLVPALGTPRVLGQEADVYR